MCVQVCVCASVCANVHLILQFKRQESPIQCLQPPLNLLDMLKSCRLKAVESLLFTEPPLSIPFSSDAGNTGFPVFMGRGEKIWLS